MRNVNVVRLELKYCENCGGLWLRRRGERRPYCQRCRHGLMISSNNGEGLHKERDAGGVGEWVEN